MYHEIGKMSDTIEYRQEVTYLRGNQNDGIWGPPNLHIDYYILINNLLQFNNQFLGKI